MAESNEGVSPSPGIKKSPREASQPSKVATIKNQGVGPPPAAFQKAGIEKKLDI
jgi:hypothetical protein